MKNLLLTLKTYKMKSVFAKNFILLFASIVMPLIITVSIFSVMYCNSIENNYTQTDKNQINTLTSVSDKILSQAKANLSLLYSNNYIKRFFYDYETVQNAQLFNQELQALENAFMLNEDNFSSIVMYSAKNSLVYNRSVINYGNFFENNPEFAEAIKNTHSIAVKRTLIDSTDCITIFVPIWSYSSDSGAIAYNLSVEKVNNYFNDITNYDGLLCLDFIFENDSVFSFNHKEISQPYSVYETDSNNYKLKYKFTISDQAKYEHLRTIKLSVSVFMLIVILSILVLSLLLSLKAYMPLSTLMRLSQSPELWANDHNITEQSSKDELEYIIAKFCNSVDFSPNDAARAAMLKQIHNVALQSQITPHFLYNTLTSINMTILDLFGDDCAASDMIVALSDYLRYTFEINNIVIPLSVELNFAIEYVKIMKYRYGDKISLKINHDKSLDNVCVLKLSLQPIIENAIYHGIIPSESEIESIIISTEKKKKSIVVSIENTGKIVTKEDIYRIKNIMCSAKESSESHIGISNVNQRIKYTFGNNYGIRVSATKDTTKFDLLFPYSTF